MEIEVRPVVFGESEKADKVIVNMKDSDGTRYLLICDSTEEIDWDSTPNLENIKKGRCCLCFDNPNGKKSLRKLIMALSTMLWEWEKE